MGGEGFTLISDVLDNWELFEEEVLYFIIFY